MANRPLLARLPIFDERASRTGSAPYFFREKAVGDNIVRTIISGKDQFNSAARRSKTNATPDFDWHWLRGTQWPEVKRPRGTLTVADLFCGLGGLSLGAWEAARAVQLQMKSTFAIDNDADAVSVYCDNFSPSYSSSDPIETLVDGKIGAKVTANEKLLVKRLGNIDLLLAGPPCQGHSDLNNHTRRDDPRNELLLKVVRFAELFQPRHILIENVQGIRHDRLGVFHKADLTLEKLGYRTTSFLLEGQTVGTPQKRRRCFLVATRNSPPNLERLCKVYSTPIRTFDWACADLQDLRAETVFDTSAKVFPANQRRMEFLIENDIFDLPDSERPDCHRLKDHDYRSVYGRLRPDAPTPTITTGFGSPGQGRFTHPRFARTLTPHEAARLQFLPDFFVFNITKRKQLQKLIGNAVPPKMAYAVIIDLLGHD